jgi:hypothetical protein
MSFSTLSRPEVDSLSAQFVRENQRSKISRSDLLIASGVGVGLAATVPLPASAAGVEDVSSMITTLGGVAAAVTIVVLGAMGVRMAIKLVNRVSVKG